MLCYSEILMKSNALHCNSCGNSHRDSTQSTGALRNHLRLIEASPKRSKGNDHATSSSDRRQPTTTHSSLGLLRSQQVAIDGFGRSEPRQKFVMDKDQTKPSRMLAPSEIIWNQQSGKLEGTASVKSGSSKGKGTSANRLRFTHIYSSFVTVSEATAEDCSR